MEVEVLEEDLGVDLEGVEMEVEMEEVKEVEDLEAE